MKKIISSILALVMVVNIGMPYVIANAQTVAGPEGSYLDKSETTTFSSNAPLSSEDEKDQVNLTANGHFLTVDFSNSEKVFEYRVSLNKPGYTKVLGYEEPVNGRFCDTFYIGHIPDDRYYLTVARAKTYEQIEHQDVGNYGDGGTYRVTPVNIRNGNIVIEKYDNIMRKNRELREWNKLKNPDWHLDTSLQDMDFVLTDPDKPHCYALTDEEIDYIRNVALKVTAGCNNDYEKAKAIYHYIGENVYYDVYCNQNDPKDAYLNPYWNLRAIEENLKLPNSTGDGKVSTLCTGYSSMNIAMLRTLGIPARMVFGFHMNTSKNMWETAEGVETRSTHYWTEFYYDGKWMSCDSYKAGANKWNRKSLDDPGDWVTRGFTNYARFNPTEQQFAVEHYGQGVFTKTILGNQSDISKLNDILLEKDSDGESNFSKLGLELGDIDQNENYLYLRNPNLMYSQTKGDKLQKVNWSGKDVSFDGIFKGFDGLKWLNVNDNPDLDYLTVTNDPEILSVYAKNCNIKNFYAINCPKLNRLYTGGNPLQYAKYAFKEPEGISTNQPNNGKTDITPHAVIRTTQGGTFSVDYINGVHKLTAKANKGYKFNGWLDANGEKVSANANITVKKATSFERKANFVKLNPVGKKPAKKKPVAKKTAKKQQVGKKAEVKKQSAIKKPAKKKSDTKSKAKVNNSKKHK